MKKKALLGTIVLATALFVGGCGKTEELTCTREATKDVFELQGNPQGRNRKTSRN